MKVNDPCPCGSGKKYKHCCLEKNTVSWRRLAAVYKRVDTAMKERISKYMEETSKPIPCKASCSFCCRGIIPATEAEGAFFVEYLKDTMSETQLEVLSGALKDWLQEATAKGLMQQFCVDPKQYADADVYCPFLEAQNCLVYQMRPLLCRGHHGLDVTHCQKWGTEIEKDGKKTFEYPVIKYDDILGPATAEIARSRVNQSKTSYWQYWIGLHLGLWTEESVVPPTVEGLLMSQLAKLQEELDKAKEVMKSLKKPEEVDGPDTAATGVTEVPDVRQVDGDHQG